MATMTIRCDEADKKAAADVAEYYGFDLSSVTRALWRQMARTRSIPLDLGYREPNEESLESIREADAIMAAGGTGKSFDSGADLIAAALEAQGMGRLKAQFSPSSPGTSRSWRGSTSTPSPLQRLSTSSSRTRPSPSIR